jgi:PAS domain S-box-containing protein
LENLAKQLAKSTNFLENLIDSSPNIVVATNQADLIESANKTSAAIFGYDKSTFIGKHISFLLETPSELDRYKSLASEETGVEVFCRKRNGGIFPARMKLRDIKDKCGVTQAKLFLLTDLSKEKEMEAKLALSEKLAIYSELMAGVAHQINNPLVGVISFSSLLLERMALDDANRELVETIAQAAQECHKMISSLTKGIREPRSTFHALDLGEILESAIENARNEEKDAAARVSLIKNIKRNLPAVRGDSLQLLQVFRNILTNAFQAMPDGGELKVSTKIERKHREVRIVFSDTGMGIPKENLSHIFEPFFSTKRKPGTGLGLSFAYQVVKAHAGRIDVTSDGSGSEFTVVLPFSDIER